MLLDSTAVKKNYTSREEMAPDVQLLQVSSHYPGYKITVTSSLHNSNKMMSNVCSRIFSSFDVKIRHGIAMCLHLIYILMLIKYY